MLNAIPLLAQGNPGEALVVIVALAGIGVVPAAIGAWALWAGRGRPKTFPVVVGLTAISAAFLMCVGAIILCCTIPSAGEEIAVEEVEAAYPVLDRAVWSYSAKHLSENLWLITVKGRSQDGQPIDKKYRVNFDEVDEAQSSAPSGWVKVWPVPSAPTSQPATVP